jgi:preprotein translocase subunit YajC
MFITPAWAQNGAPGAGPLDMLVQIFPFIVFAVILYFMVFRPQQQREKARRERVAAVRRGDVVYTSSGIIGKVRNVSESDDEVTLEIAKGVEVKVIRSMLADVQSKTEPAPAKAAAEAKSKDGDSGKAT